MSLYFLTTDQWVPSVRSNDTREWNEINAAATYRIASPPLVSEDPLHAPLRPASIGRPERGKAPPFLPEDWSASAASSSPLSTRSRNRVRYKVGCVRVPVRGVCGVLRGAWGVGGAPVSSGLVRRLGPCWPVTLLDVRSAKRPSQAVPRSDPHVTFFQPGRAHEPARRPSANGVVRAKIRLNTQILMNGHSNDADHKHS